MKKRYFIGIMLFIVFIVIAITMIVLSQNNNPLTKISVFSWDITNKFILCEIEVKSADRDEQSCTVFPQDKEAFINIMKTHEGYLGNSFVSYMGAKDENGYVFYYDDALFMVSKWNDGYILTAGVWDFTYFDANENYYRYRYLTLANFDPSNSSNPNNYTTFDQTFISYEKQYSFYGHLSENVAKFDEEQQKIYLRIYDVDERKKINDKRVCIDFIAKDVYVEEGITW